MGQRGGVTPLCRMYERAVRLFVQMTGRIEVDYEPPDYPDLNDPEVRERLRAEAYEEAKKEVERKIVIPHPVFWWLRRA